MSKKNVNVGSDQRVHVTKDSVPLNPPPAPAPAAALAVAPPTVTIATPAPNATLTGTVTLDAVPHSAGTIASVKFVNGIAQIGNASASAFGWVLSWDTTAVPDGTHLLTAVATDTLGQTGAFSIDVTVSNVAAPTGKVLVADNTDATETTSVINTWIANNSLAGDTVLVPAGTYWVDGPVNIGNTRTLQAQDALNPPVFHRHTVFPYRIKPDLRPTLSGAAAKVAVPAYWNPPSAFDTQLDNAGTAVGFAVINVNSGPDSSGPQSAYTTQIANNRAAGIKSYGYVHTSSGSRALATCETEIDHWYQWYALDGIFFDEAPGTGWTSGQKTYYSNLFNYVRAKTGANVRGKTVVLNPGTVVDQFAMNVCDVVCDYEDTEANYQNATFPTWRASFPASRFWHIVISSAGVTQMQHDLALAGTRNAGYVYVTQDGGSNPYDTLPSSTFWAAELAKAATVGVVANPAYNPNGRSSSWQYDLLGGQASIPTSLGNPNVSGTPSLGASNGGYDAKTLRSGDGTQILGLQSLYGALWTQADVGAVVQYLVASGANGSYQSTVKSVASDGKSLLFDTPTASSGGTHEGSEGTVAWCRHQKGAGWKVEHQTNDLLSFYVGPLANKPWSGYQNALSAARDAQQQPIVQFTDTTACVVDGIVWQHSNDGWRSSILNFEKSDPLITEFMRAVESKSPNQIVRNCTIKNTWGAGEHGPAQLLNCNIHHVGMQCCTGHWDNKLIDGGVWQQSHHTIIDIEQTFAVSNVTIQNLIVGGPKPLVSYSSEVDGLTIKNIQSTNAQVTAGTINAITDMWGGSGDLGYTVTGKNHLITGCEMDDAANGHIANPAMTITNIAGLTVTNNKIPTSGVFLRYGNSTNVTSTGNDGGNGVNATTQKAT